MNSDKLQELRRLAEQATQGEWKSGKSVIGLHPKKHVVWTENNYVCESIELNRVSDLSYIAAANPATILRLLDLIERQAKVVDAARYHIKVASKSERKQTFIELKQALSELDNG